MENRPGRVTNEEAVGTPVSKERRAWMMANNYWHCHDLPGIVLCILYELSHLILIFTAASGALRKSVLQSSSGFSPEWLARGQSRNEKGRAGLLEGGVSVCFGERNFYREMARAWILCWQLVALFPWSVAQPHCASVSSTWQIGIWLCSRDCYED